MDKIVKIDQCSEGLQTLLRKMFDIVEAPHDLYLVDEWYSKYEWDEEQEKEFKDFFMEFTKKDPNRYDVIARSCRNKKQRDMAFSTFNLMYGWKRKEGDSDEREIEDDDR